MIQNRTVSDLSVLLLQIREHGPVREEEVQSFLRHGGLKATQMTILNVFDTPCFEPEVVDGYDAIFVGGASEASVLDPEAYPFVAHIITMLQYCITRDVPVFASCFGFQAAVLGLGGEIIRDREEFEMGTLPMDLTESAKSDPIFCGLEDRFLAVSCHQELAREVPQGCVSLATTSKCLHAFRVGSKPFWAFQFHPELDLDCFIQRLGIFRAKYTASDSAYEDVTAQFKETPVSNHLLGRFLSFVLTL